MISKKYHQALSILIIVAAVYYSFYSLMPTAKIEKQESTTEFSIDNALKQLKEISKKPHFTGSSEHKIVKAYIVSELEKLGLQVEVQQQMAVNGKWKAATEAHNILARIKGSEKGKALLLLSHYDSNPHSSLGASDAGSGVVTILEGVRAFLAKNETPKNDIIVCITDAEELGLLGANAFVNHHPWAKDVGLVLNFEARGSGGPSYMLIETNGGNKKLIEAFQKAKTPYPVANSLMYSLYKMLPNDTDLTVFREEGDIDGFNFAFISDHFDYHTVQDSYERLDIKSLKHQETYFTATLNYFANTNLEDLKAQQDYVFFNFPYFGLVFYPFSWVVPLFLICVVIFLALLIIGISNNKLSFKEILKGFVPFILSLIFSGLIGFYGWKLLVKIHPQYNDILHGFTYNGYFYIAAFVSLTLAISFWFYKGFFRKRASQNLAIAPLFFWLLLNGGIAFYLKGGSFFILPVIILLIIVAILIFTKTEKENTLYFTILMVPVLLIVAPLIKMLPIGLGLKMLFVSSIFTVLLFGVLVPIFKNYRGHNNLSKIFFLMAVLGFASAAFTSSYSEERKQPNSILYVYDTNENEAYWASYNKKTDEFTKQFLGENPIEGSYNKNTTASKYKTKIKLHRKAEIKKLEKPLIKVVSDTIINDSRKVCFSLISQRNANKFEILTNKPLQFKSLKVNDEAIKNIENKPYVLSVEKGTVMSYYITKENEIIDFEFVVDKDQEFDLVIIEAKYDLFTNPQFEIRPRNDVMIPMPFVLNDATVIKTNIKF